MTNPLIQDPQADDIGVSDPIGDQLEPEEEGEEEDGSDDELAGFMCLENDGSISTHGQVSPYTMQLMTMIQSMVNNNDQPTTATSSTMVPQSNPGSRAARRAARNERLRKLRKKGGK